MMKYKLISQLKEYKDNNSSTKPSTQKYCSGFDFSNINKFMVLRNFLCKKIKKFNKIFKKLVYSWKTVLFVPMDHSKLSISNISMVNQSEADIENEEMLENNSFNSVLRIQNSWRHFRLKKYIFNYTKN